MIARMSTILALFAVAGPATAQTILDKFIGKLTKRGGGQAAPQGGG